MCPLPSPPLLNVGCGKSGFSLHSDGAGHKCLTLGYNGEERGLGGEFAVTSGRYDTLGMNGRDVYKFATREVTESAGVVHRALFFLASFAVSSSSSSRLISSAEIENRAWYRFMFP